MVVRGTIQNGHVIPSQPLGLPEGHAVYIVTLVAPSPRNRDAAIARVRARAINVSLQDRAFDTDGLYDDLSGNSAEN